MQGWYTHLIHSDAEMQSVAGLDYVLNTVRDNWRPLIWLAISEGCNGHTSLEVMAVGEQAANRSGSCLFARELELP
jgi:hypothetical protein